jgi:NAD(P)-dependent dehydrogenase (short-subunit alcohol dehydrogenase family)
MPRPTKAAGSVALVTGANRGIGLAFVRELAARGAKKIYAGVRTPGDLADEFSGLPLAVEVVPLDVTDLAAVRAAAAACPDVNLLVNNAGLFANKRLVLTDDPDAARREMEVNYFGVLNMTRAFARAGLDALDRGEHVADTDFMAIDARASYARDPIRYERGMTKLLKVTTMDTGR